MIGSIISNVINIFCIVLTIIIFVSPFPMYSKLETPNVSVLPLLAILIQSLFWATYGVFLDDYVLMLINGVGISCGLFYTYLYIRTRPTFIFYLKLAGGLLFYLGILFILLLFANYETETAVFGYISIGMSLLLFASPLGDLLNVLKKKDSSSLPLPLMLANTGATISWTIYGILKGNWNIIIPNAIGIVICCVTLVVKKKYYKRKVKDGFVPIPTEDDDEKGFLGNERNEQKSDDGFVEEESEMKSDDGFVEEEIEV